MGRSPYQRELELYNHCHNDSTVMCLLHSEKKFRFCLLSANTDQQTFPRSSQSLTRRNVIRCGPTSSRCSFTVTEIMHARGICETPPPQQRPSRILLQLPVKMCHNSKCERHHNARDASRSTYHVVVVSVLHLLPEPYLPLNAMVPSRVRLLHFGFCFYRFAQSMKLYHTSSDDVHASKCNYCAISLHVDSMICSRILWHWNVNDLFNDATAWMDFEM